MTSQLFTINARKFDRTVHRSWSARFVERSGSRLTFEGIFGERIEHPHLGVIRPGTVSLEHYWTDRWYSIFRFQDPAGLLRNFYCNVNMPAVPGSNVLDYVDLDIDVLVWSDMSCEVLDRDEFEANARIFPYPDLVRSRALESLVDLLGMIRRREFPFDQG